ncbi:MAG: hypothetical protein ACOYXC_14410 [Candidatus Rifleibacteriota bacterium]
MNKKTCCACGCLIMALGIVAIVAGGYFGVSFLHSAGKDFAALTFEKGMESVTEKAFSEEDRQEILDGAKLVAEGIKSGEIGLISMFSEGTQQLETGIYNKVILLAFKNHYMLKAEDGAEATFSVEGARSVDRLLFGLSEKRISVDQIASVTLKLTEHFQDKMPDKDGKSNVKFSSRRVNTKLSKEDVVECLKMINEVCDLNKIENPSEEFKPENVIKNELLQVFDKLKKSGESQKK